MSTNPGSRIAGQPRSTSEWVTLFLSVAIVGGVVVMIVWLMISGADDPPILVTDVEMNNVTESEAGYLLPIIVSNDGDRAAIEVVVEVTLSREEIDETSAFTIMLLPSKQQDTGFVVFANDPREHTLEVGIRSFQEP
ncbi:hypothetical protein BH23CHL5_BH23CHL5_13420 [soil metagenome]